MRGIEGFHGINEGCNLRIVANKIGSPCICQWLVIDCHKSVWRLANGVKEIKPR